MAVSVFPLPKGRHMDTTAVLKLLLHGNQLKRTPRTGWVQRGVPNAENVAAHSVAWCTLFSPWRRCWTKPST
ncbi:MAG: hypothetical protein M5U34_25360 [Chloroflexi bacterium]|nr:hypothetical protein [Chloroflexota bacterium]